MSDFTAFDLHATSAPFEQRKECSPFEIKQKLDDLIYKEQVNQLWKLGMESMLHSVWAKVCAQNVSVSVSCQTDEQIDQHGVIPIPPEEKICLGFGSEEDSEQKRERNPAKRSLEGNVFFRVNECDVLIGSLTLAEHGSSPSIVAGAHQEEHSEPDSQSRSENVDPYQCAHCESKFSRKDEFLKHQRSHLKSFKRHKKCHLCLRVFKNQRGLQEHTKRGVCRKAICYKNKEHVCTVCGQAFYFQSTLNDHMTSHTGEKLNQCQVCSARYRYQTSLYRHLRKHHSE